MQSYDNKVNVLQMMFNVIKGVLKNSVFRYFWELILSSGLFQLRCPAGWKFNVFRFDTFPLKSFFWTYIKIEQDLFDVFLS